MGCRMVFGWSVRSFVFFVQSNTFKCRFVTVEEHFMFAWEVSTMNFVIISFKR